MILKIGLKGKNLFVDVYEIMKIISINGTLILNTENIHFFLDSSEKKTGFFCFKKQPRNYNCPHRGVVPSYKLVQATDIMPQSSIFKAYYLPFRKNDVTSISLESTDDFNYFFTDMLDGCSVGISTDEIVTRLYHANAYKYGEFLYRKEKMRCSFALRRQINIQSKMIRKVADDNVRIISPWHYGHYGEHSQFYKTLLWGYKNNSSGIWTFLRQTYDIRNIEGSWFR